MTVVLLILASILALWTTVEIQERSKWLRIGLGLALVIPAPFAAYMVGGIEGDYKAIDYQNAIRSVSDAISQGYCEKADRVLADYLASDPFSPRRVTEDLYLYRKSR